MGRTTALRPSRTTAVEIGRVATAPIEDSPIPGALITVRLFGTGDRDAQGEWREGSTICCLAHDLIGASGGVIVDAFGPFISARFTAVDTACRAARRLQWAVQGMAEGSPSGRLSLGILLQAGEDISRRESSAPDMLQKAEAGKIIVAKCAAKVLDPAFLTRGGTAAIAELTWRAPEGQTTPVADERTLARLTAEIHGTPIEAADPQPRQSEATVIMPAPPLSKTSEAWSSDPRPRRNKMIWGGGLVAVAGAILLLVLFLTRGPQRPTTQTAETQSAPNPAQTSASPAPVKPLSAPPQNASVTQQAERKTPEKPVPPQGSAPRDKGKAQPAESHNRPPASHNPPAAKNESQVPQPQPAQPQPDASRGDCQYQPDQIPGLLGRAESSRARGQYADAKRMFMAVLACDRGNHRAEEGLQQVLQAVKAAGSDEE
jgi:hypothetical protein